MTWNNFDIEICDDQNILEVDQEQLRCTIEYVLQQMKVSNLARVSLALVDDERIRELEERYFDQYDPPLSWHI